LYGPSSRLLLSTTRNIVLRQLAAGGAMAADALVSFPDNDCWYPPELLVQVAELLARDESLDFSLCRYSSLPT
jgi:hypothetical protein